VSHYGPVHVVRAWLAAANEREADRVGELSAPDVEVVGPRGADKMTTLGACRGCGVHSSRLGTFS